MSNQTLCICRRDNQLTDLPAEEITKMIIEGIFLPENTQYNILIKPWKIKFWCGNCSSSHKRNAFGKQFKFIHGQKTRQASCGHWSCWMTRAMNKWQGFLHALLAGLVSLEICQPRYFCHTTETQGGQKGKLTQQWFIYPMYHKESCNWCHLYFMSKCRV